MIKALLVTASPGAFAPFSTTLTSGGCAVARVCSGQEALEAMAQEAPDLVIVDEQPRDMPAKELVKRVVALNPFINTAVVSGLSPEDFHEAFEGLGVLAQLSPRPGLVQAQGLLQRLGELPALPRS